MRAFMLTLLALVVAFLVGSIPTGVIVARAKGVDLRKVGSGNIGATNVSRALGKKWATLVLVADAAKGGVPVVLAGHLEASSWLPSLVGLCAVLGQIFSVFLRGRGGKGVATSLGAGFALAPLPAFACAGVFAICFALFRIASIGSLAGVAAYPLFLWLFHLATWPRLTFAGAVFALVLARHRENLARLCSGREYRV
jgi:glycerol-3-phosphate acyltransferase PlsY